MWQEITSKLNKMFDVGILTEKFVKFLPSLISAIIYLIFFYIIWKIISKSIKMVFSRGKLDETVSDFISELFKYTFLTIALVSALGELGINTASILASLGVVGLTIGFAAKDTLSNLISGIFIFWDRPFTTGDLVEISGYYGRVKAITMRSTRVVTVDGKMIAIPNTIIVNSTVISYTNFPSLRLDIDVTIGVNEDINRVRKLLLNMINEDNTYLKEPVPQVVMTAINDFNVAIQIRAWIEDERQHVAKRFAFREQIFNLLRDNKVEMPFETFQLAPFEIKNKD